MFRKIDVKCKLLVQNGLMAWEKGIERALCTSTNCYDTEITAFAKSEVLALSENKGETIDRGNGCYLY